MTAENSPSKDLRLPVKGQDDDYIKIYSNPEDYGRPGGKGAGAGVDSKGVSQEPSFFRHHHPDRSELSGGCWGFGMDTKDIEVLGLGLGLGKNKGVSGKGSLVGSNNVSYNVNTRLPSGGNVLEQLSEKNVSGVNSGCLSRTNLLSGAPSRKSLEFDQNYKENLASQFRILEKLD